ncbi:transmembrane protein, putative [Medicago truncatula]|uniref:Transmembrane protein, putative n=1 Tax=Medicago truncatula TaxID=3880 RepID=A0A072TY41_MEDTR|nr:transmembrane protein, putative [Medicago truncatula]
MEVSTEAFRCRAPEKRNKTQFFARWGGVAAVAVLSICSRQLEGVALVVAAPPRRNEKPGGAGGRPGDAGRRPGGTGGKPPLSYLGKPKHLGGEVNIDDIVVKSSLKNSHLNNLRQSFKGMRKYRLKMNPFKCAFCVPASDYLGIVVHKKAIEINQNKKKEYWIQSLFRQKRDFSHCWKN